MTTEVFRESPLFEAFVQVRIYGADRDDRLATLVVRVLNGMKVSSTLRENLLHIELTDESDPYFLYSMDVSEEDYHMLKADQNLLVEFHNFAPKFIELLEHCVQKSGENGSQEEALNFAAALDTRTPHQATFDLIEANKFKNLTHLRLRMVKGTDAAIKSYLAARQEQFQRKSEMLAKKLEETENALAAEGERGRELDQRVTETDHRLELAQEFAENARESLIAKINGEHQSELTKERQEHMKMISEMEKQHHTEANALQVRLDKLLSDMPELVAERATLRARNEELENIESQRVRQIEASKEDIERLRLRNRELDNSKFELEKQVQKQEVQMDGLKQQLQDKEDVVEQMSRRLEAAGTQRISLEESLAMYKSSLDKLESKFQASVSEINKGNDIIQRIHAEQRQLRSKLKVKGAIMAKQEEHLAGKEKEIDLARAQQRELESGLSRANDTIARNEQELLRVKGSLAEANKLLKSNQQVINWLNKEINELQMQGTRSLGPSSAQAGLGEFGRATEYLMPTKKLEPVPVIPTADSDARLIARLKSVAAPTEPLGELGELNMKAAIGTLGNVDASSMTPLRASLHTVTGRPGDASSSP